MTHVTHMNEQAAEVALGGEKATVRTMCGALLVCLGVAMCVSSKLHLN